ncbi:Hypothetical predicted protein [Lecanosticta acicola]|uniref:Uncharacterized protein n=1 Tax=Lecanosticta acicola TaxID=111012 RepID=A0AAI9ECM7_9PEZI|nr:Hypothetical predicted protein [Lecanosticta acicola]
MSTRTKSFFDTDQRMVLQPGPQPMQVIFERPLTHTTQPRPGQWSRRPHAQPARNEAPANVPPPKPPIPATTQAKSKLQAFQYAPDDEGQIVAAQEDDVSGENQQTTDGSSNAAQSAPDELVNGSSRQAPSLPHANTFPCTPGARLPLEDLIGNCDEAQREEPVYYSPEEQLGWNPNSSGLTPNQRKRKRAKSSSPACPTTSSQDKTSAFFGDGGAPSTAKRTPAADPAADLWQRYANGRQSGERLKPNEVGSLMFLGSPRPMETPIKSGPFRRWASTGNDWPSTKNKRRCTAGGQGTSVWQDQTAIESGGKSKVATMVQRIQETLASQRLEKERQTSQPHVAEGPSSSSPLPEKGAENFPTPGAVSPLQIRQPNIRSPPKVHPRAPEPKSRPPSQGIRTTQSGGFRVDLSKPVGDPLNPSSTGLYLQSKAKLPAYKRPSITRPLSQTKVKQIIAPPIAATVSKDFDEFGDDAFDLTADDLDELLSQKPLEQRSLYDIPQHPNPHRQSEGTSVQPSKPTVPRQTITLADDDDEFGGDDIDEESFTQAEFSATQAHRVSQHF